MYISCVQVLAGAGAGVASYIPKSFVPFGVCIVIFIYKFPFVISILPIIAQLKVFVVFGVVMFIIFISL
jgi:hypothetical protein